MELEIVDAGDRSVGDDTLRTSRKRHLNANPPNDRQQPRNQSEESSAVKLTAESLLDRSPAKESGAAGHRMETYIDSMDMEQGSNTTASAQREAHEDPDIEEPSGLSVCEPELSNDPAEDIAFDAPRLARSAVVHQSPIAVDSHSSTTTTTTTTPWNTQSQPSTPASLRASPGVEGSLNQCPSIATAVTGRANRQPRQRVDLMDSPPDPVHDCDLARNCSQADQSAEASPAAEPASPFDEFDLAGLQRARNLPADAHTSRLARLPSLRKRKRRTRPTRLGDKLIFSFDGTAVSPEGEIIGTCALLQTLKREDRPEADDDLQDAAHASTPACDLGDATSMNAKKPRASCDEPCEIQSVTFGLQFESQLQKPARLLDVASTSASATRDAPGLQETARKEGALLPAEAGVAAGSPASSESMDITEKP
ncbi:hypothetical protein F1559_001062 [Cyanidiococcus yangmingshanensis]|uniref:Uncharacterized protein n=1 Tax=Cyanidiococcus yangmingshanensis TaxID=2690220 RepID=A0A7J7IK21_9RHOD|nr:hypothetical protein F1559_001062 [Cyanidiococcus yangmingshanensis]